MCGAELLCRLEDAGGRREKKRDGESRMDHMTDIVALWSPQPRSGSSRYALGTASRTSAGCSPPRSRPTRPPARRRSPARRGRPSPARPGAADGRRRGGACRGGRRPATRTSGWCSTDAGWTARSPRQRRDQLRGGRHRRVLPAQPGHDHVRRRGWHDLAPVARAAGLRITVTLAAAFGCPFTGEVPPRACGMWPPPPRRRPDELASPTRSASASRARSPTSPPVRAVEPGCRCARTSTTPATPGTPTRSPRSTTASPCSTLGRRHRRLPFAPDATGNIATEDLAYLLTVRVRHRGRPRGGRRHRTWIGDQLGLTRAPPARPGGLVPAAGAPTTPPRRQRVSFTPGGAPMTIAGGIREFARATPRATAVIDGDRTLTFAALDERASRLAATLLGTGCSPATGSRCCSATGWSTPRSRPASPRPAW